MYMMGIYMQKHLITEKFKIFTVIVMEIKLLCTLFWSDIHMYAK